jgi:osmotically inducible lipoprotein OsmB
MSGKAVLRTGALGCILATAMALSACGTTPGERAVSGGLIGAGTGAAIGSVTGSAGKGAIIGGIGGAAVGALTAPPRDRYAYEPVCLRYSSYTGQCLEWD